VTITYHAPKPAITRHSLETVHRYSVRQLRMPTKLELVAIVEDDESMRRSLERLLQANDYATIAFASAEEFLQSTIVDGAIGLVLDIHLGGMSGIELRRRLAAARSKTPVVFITAFDDNANRAVARSLGCADYLQKPFEAQRLICALERCAKA
jgi:FixJ family two-component response regulator